MAKLTVTVTVTVTVTILLLTFVLSGASSVSSTPENDFTVESLTTLSAEPDPDSTIPDLTGSGSGSDSVPKVPSSGETTGRGPELPSSDEITVPVSFMNFHPINRHFPRRPLTTTSFNRRPCRFHHHRRHELWGEGVKIPYGDDMIFSGKEKATHTDHSPHGVVSDIAFTEMVVGSDERNKKITVMTAKHHTSKYILHHEEEDHAIKINNFGEGEAEESSFMELPATRVKLIKYEGKHKKEHKDVFMRKIRKFLNHVI